MDSSNAMPFRVLVMFACLIALPLLAVFGISLPDLARGVWSGRNEAKAEAIRSRLDDAPRFAVPRPGPRGDAAVGTQVAWSRSQREDPRTNETAQREPRGLAPASPSRPIPQTSSQPSAAKLDAGDPTADIQQRLRQLGATYYHLENWGQGGNRFRFSCKMAVGGDPRRTQHFEAVSTSPIEAMGAVLRRVEAWGVEFRGTGL